MAYPDAVVGVDPGSRVQAFKLFAAVQGIDVFRYGNGLKAVFVRKPLIQVKEKISAVVLVMFPCIFAVEDDRHHMRRVGWKRVPDVQQSLDEIISSFPRLPLGIDKADKVRERMVPKDHRDIFRGVGAIEHMRIG